MTGVSSDNAGILSQRKTGAASYQRHELCVDFFQHILGRIRCGTTVRGELFCCQNWTATDRGKTLGVAAHEMCPIEPDSSSHPHYWRVFIDLQPIDAAKYTLTQNCIEVAKDRDMLDWLLETLFPPRTEPLLSVTATNLWADPQSTDGFGLVGIGGDLCAERLLSAYRQGIFPMYEEGEPICWWSPDPRAIFDIDGLHIPRRLRRSLRAGDFEVSLNQNFVGVMKGCADRPEGTWITSDMLEAYHRLHELGHAHSVEVWRNGELTGGVYGVAIGAFFAGESMFSRDRDASKIALVHLFERLQRCGFELFDTQILNEHTARLGAYEITRSEYLQRLAKALKKKVSVT